MVTDQRKLKSVMKVSLNGDRSQNIKSVIEISLNVTDYRIKIQ